MRRYYRLAIALAIVLAGAVLLPRIAFPTERFGWQLFSGVYEPVADVGVNKYATQSSVGVGQPFLYGIMVTNYGPSIATGVTVVDPLPANVTFVSSSSLQGSCSGTSTVTCNLGSLPIGTTWVYIEVTPTTVGLVFNTATVSANEADPYLANNSSTWITQVTDADLSVTKSDSPDPVNVGETLTYVVTVDNAGPSDATNVTLVDTLPAGVSFGSATPSQGSCNGTSTVTCNLGTLPAGLHATVTIGVTPGIAGEITNVAQVSATEFDSDLANNDTTESTMVVAADLAVSKYDAPDPAVLGQDLTYTIEVINKGPDTATGVTLVDTLPAEVAFVSATPTQGTCSGTGPVTCDLGTLASGASATVTIVVTPQEGGTLVNTADVAANEGDPVLNNNTATASTAVNPADLAVTKTGSPDPVVVGEPLTYELEVLNNGPSAATSVALVDTLPAGVTFVSATPSQGGCSGTSTVTCDLGTLADGAAATVTIMVTPVATGTLVNTAELTLNEPDPDPDNNTAAVESLAIAGSAVIIDPAEGVTLTYSDTEGVEISVDVPAGAVDAVTTLALAPASTPGHGAPSGLTFAGQAFALDAYQNGVLQPDFAFLVPIVVTVHYSDADVAGLDELSLVLEYWDGSQWQDVATTCDPASLYDYHPDENWLSVSICHLSQFALFGTEETGFWTYLPLVLRNE